MQFLKRFFSFKGRITSKVFYKKMIGFILLYIALVIMRGLIFIVTLMISDETTVPNGVNTKMKPLEDAILAWFIVFILTQIPYMFALTALMVRRINDTNTPAIVVVILNVIWFVGNFVVLFLLFSFNLAEHLLISLLLFNSIMFIILLIFLNQPSRE